MSPTLISYLEYALFILVKDNPKLIDALLTGVLCLSLHTFDVFDQKISPPRVFEAMQEATTITLTNFSFLKASLLS